MGSRLYVGNLSYSTTESQLKDLFEVHGEIASVAIVLDRMSGRSRGFGFVEFASESDAQKAIEAMHGSEVDGRTLTVNEARARTEGNRRGPSGGGFRDAGPPVDSYPPRSGGGSRGGRHRNRPDRGDRHDD